MENEAVSPPRNTDNDPIPIPKIPTGVRGLDEILHGGIPEQSVTLIEGGPGTGKTMLGLESLYRSALAGRPAVFVTFEESADAVRRNARAMGWDLETLEKEGKFFLFHAPIEHNAVRSGQFNIQPLLAIIQGKAQQIGAKLIMIDALDVLMRIFNDPAAETNEIYSLHDWLAENEFTTLLTVKRYTSDTVRQYEFLGFMADCVLLLDLRVEAQVATRRLRVIKYRGSGFGSNEYPYIINENGSIILPISRISLERVTPGGRVSSGIPELDTLLDGGFQTNSSILVTGATGTGKTTLACTFVREMYRRKERSLYISFEESDQNIVAAMKSPGIDLRPALESGGLRFLSLMPESNGLEQHLVEIFRTFDEFKPRYLVVDAVSATRRMGGSPVAFTFMMRLIDFCRQRQITSLLLNQIDRTDTTGDFSGIGIASILDTVVLLDYVKSGSRLLRTLLVLKSRGSRHSNQYHQYQVTDRGIQILAPLDVGAGPPCTPQTPSTSDTRGKGHHHAG